MKAPGPFERLIAERRSWRSNLAMEANVKLLESPDGKNHLIIIVAGTVDVEGLERIFRQIADTIQRLFNCKVLIDFEKASLNLQTGTIDALADKLGPNLRLGNIKIALVKPGETGESEQVTVLSESLCREDLTAAVFDNAKEAVGWLVNTL